MKDGMLPVSNWKSIVHKNVRSQDGERVGNVVAVLTDTIHVDCPHKGPVRDSQGKCRRV